MFTIHFGGNHLVSAQEGVPSGEGVLQGERDVPSKWGVTSRGCTWHPPGGTWDQAYPQRDLGPGISTSWEEIWDQVYPPTPSCGQNDLQRPMKTLPSCNFICGR